MCGDMSEEFQARVTEDGVVHMWRRGEKEPLEARWDICPQGCLNKRGNPQRLQPEKTEFPGKKGKVRRTYKCPKCGCRVRTIPRQKQKDTKWILKEPERHGSKGSP